MKTFRRFLTVGSLAVVACAVSSAASITVNCTLASGNTEFGNGTLGTTNSTITCGDFNTALGTLASIQLTLDGAVVSTSTMTLTNNDSAAHTGNATTVSSFSLDPATTLSGFSFATIAGPDNVTGATNYLFDVNGPTGTQSLGGNPNSPAVCGGNVLCSKTVGVSGSSNESATDTTNFVPYEGLGNFAITADTRTAFSCNILGGNAGCQQSTNDSFTAQVVYTYNPPSTTPEPATMFLMGSALVGVGVLRKRFKA
jgi:PEP-CTERM motif